MASAKPAPPPDEECIALLHRAVERGINYIDTASVYGRSEEIVGKAFANFDDPPLSSLPRLTLERPIRVPTANGSIHLRTYVEESVQLSLEEALCTESLDVSAIAQRPRRGSHAGLSWRLWLIYRSADS